MKLQSRMAGAEGVLTIASAPGGGLRILSKGGSAHVLQPDIFAASGSVVHVVDGLLLPMQLPALPLR